MERVVLFCFCCWKVLFFGGIGDYGKIKIIRAHTQCIHTYKHTHTHTQRDTHTIYNLIYYLTFVSVCVSQCVSQCVSSSVVGGCEIDHWIAFGVWSSAGGVVGSPSTMPSSKAPFKCLLF